MKTVKIGLIGYGLIGQGVIRLLKENGGEIAARLGARLELAGVADVDISRPRKVKVKKQILTNDPSRLINDPDIPIIIELAGDWPGVKDQIIAALRAGKSVVTANKALLAKHGDEIWKTAAETGQDIYYEASVCGTIPIIRVLREGLAANKIQAIYGIVNGTCNYILTGMTRGLGDYREILAQAQAKGYAEARPEADVEGYDAAHKLAILVRLGFGIPIKLSQIHREGITKIESADIMAADHLGFAIKLLAIAKVSNGGLEARVHPTLVPKDSTLAAVAGPYNAVYVLGNMAGPTIYYGQGAGQEPTAAAVVGDVMELARRVISGAPPRRLHSGAFQDDYAPTLKPLPMPELETEYYLRMHVADRPGVLSRVAGVLGENKISIKSVIQRNRERGPVASIVIMTHKAREEMMQKAQAQFKKLREVKGQGHMIRVETNL
ncbi:MAG TPA: homoserine dehydrogenase [bacterium]|nr:homoserine dehydrogenase [bacterium]